MNNRFPLFLLTLVLSLGNLQASVKETPTSALEPTREQAQAALLMQRVIQRYHYKKVPLDDQMSQAILERYLDTLDPNRSFFTQRDIDSFQVYRTRLDDDLRRARLQAAFDIFRVFRQRVDERIEMALERLQQDFDFSLDENYRFDRTDEPWAADTKALDELWRKRIKNDVLSLKLRDKKEPEIRKTLAKRYEGVRRRTHQFESSDIFQMFINAYTLSLEPHTSYMSPRVSENFDISMRLSLEGIGAVLSSENEYTKVVRTVAGGPAALSGKVKPGDRIVGVGQGEDGEIEDVVGWRLQDVVDLIRGHKGSVVRLALMRDGDDVSGKTRVVRLVRNKIKLEDQAAKSRVIEGIDGLGSVRIGVIDLPAFYRDFRGQSSGDQDFRSTTRDVRRLIGEMQKSGIDGLIIDLRGNGGGSLAEATELTGLFIPSGPVVQVKNASGELDIERDPDPELVYGGPLAVLVDRNSASASEIFAGAIQDYGRGLIVGEPTFGKGTVQTLVDLDRFVAGGEPNRLGRLRLTMAQFFRVAGGSTQFMGVVPDIVFPTASGSEEQGERGLDNALPWARIEAAEHLRYSLGGMNQLREMHRRRIKSDPGFIYLDQEAQLLKKLRRQKTVSLLESRRRQEWEEQEARRKEIKNRFLTAIGLPPEDDSSVEKETAAGDEDKKDDPVQMIQLNETARILADYISGQRQAAMLH